MDPRLRRKGGAGIQALHRVGRGCGPSGIAAGGGGPGLAPASGLYEKLLARPLPGPAGKGNPPLPGDWYGRTLESYRRLFQEEPPSDIWPSPTRKRRESGLGRWIDPVRFWLLP